MRLIMTTQAAFLAIGATLAAIGSPFLLLLSSACLVLAIGLHPLRDR